MFKRTFNTFATYVLFGSFNILCWLDDVKDKLINELCWLILAAALLAGWTADGLLEMYQKHFLKEAVTP